MDTLEKLEERINQALALIEKLSGENKTLKNENENLKKELSDARGRLTGLESSEAEKSERIKTRLNSILTKLNALEQG